MNKLVISAWVIYEFENQYFLPYTHWIYLEQIEKKFDAVLLVSPVLKCSKSELMDMNSISCYENVFVERLPAKVGFMVSLPFVFHYGWALWKHRDANVSYVRFPVSFSWLLVLLQVGRRKIFHFVGDPVETIVKNKKISKPKKNMLKFLFQGEEFLCLWAAANSDAVFTNGITFTDRLDKKKISYNSLISTTLRKSDIVELGDKQLNEPVFMFLGYLRQGKSVDTLLHALRTVKEVYPSCHLHLVGEGDQAQPLVELAKNLGVIENVSFYGHINDRDRLQSIALKCSQFWFASVSEGSPRVIIEAVNWGLPVISTPVGSLPDFFKEDEEMIFFDVGNSYLLAQKSIELLNDSDSCDRLRLSAHRKIKSLDIESFIGRIFDA